MVSEGVQVVNLGMLERAVKTVSPAREKGLHARRYECHLLLRTRPQ
jgi:hypothetical protein